MEKWLKEEFLPWIGGEKLSSPSLLPHSQPLSHGTEGDGWRGTLNGSNLVVGYLFYHAVQKQETVRFANIVRNKIFH